MANQVRVDPLTGLKVIIAAARAGRPGGHFDLDAVTPIDTEKDPPLPQRTDPGVLTASGESLIHACAPEQSAPLGRSPVCWQNIR